MQAYFCPCSCVFHRIEVLIAIRHKVFAVVKLVISAIKLKSVDAIALLHVAQLIDKVATSIGIGKVEHRTLTVPPFNNSWLLGRIFEQIALFGKQSVFRRVGSDKRTDP